MAIGVTVAEALKDVALVVMAVAGGAGLYSSEPHEIERWRQLMKLVQYSDSEDLSKSHR